MTAERIASVLTGLTEKSTSITSDDDADLIFPLIDIVAYHRDYKLSGREWVWVLRNGTTEYVLTSALSDGDRMNDELNWLLSIFEARLSLLSMVRPKLSLQGLVPLEVFLPSPDEDVKKEKVCSTVL